MNIFEGKVIFISGGTGSRGQELTKQLLPRNPKEIRIFSRGEHKQVEMKRNFTQHKNVKFFVGDVRDHDRVKSVMSGTDIVFHLAALKHVPVCEENPYESVLTNIIGTQNIISSAIEHGVEKVIDVSTDKACDPFNLYGTCKAVGEKLMIAANNQSQKTSFVCVRGGNVLGTNGSVVPLFKEQILKTNTVTLTDPLMTRYIMRLEEAVGMLIHASIVSKGGEIFVMKMSAITVDMLANAMIGLFGNNTTEKIVIGSRPGEKADELLVSQYEAVNTYQYDSKYFVILPSVPTGRSYADYKQLRKIEEPFFSSKNTIQLTVEEFQAMVRDDGRVSKTMPSEIELQQLSKDEILNYFKNQGWVK